MCVFQEVLRNFLRLENLKIFFEIYGYDFRKAISQFFMLGDAGMGFYGHLESLFTLH
jgi:hypothetical protein